MTDDPLEPVAGTIEVSLDDIDDPPALHAKLLFSSPQPVWPKDDDITSE